MSASPSMFPERAFLGVCDPVRPQRWPREICDARPQHVEEDFLAPPFSPSPLDLNFHGAQDTLTTVQVSGWFGCARPAGMCSRCLGSVGFSLLTAMMMLGRRTSSHAARMPRVLVSPSTSACAEPQDPEVTALTQPQNFMIRRVAGGKLTDNSTLCSLSLRDSPLMRRTPWASAQAISRHC